MVPGEEPFEISTESFNTSAFSVHPEVNPVLESSQGIQVHVPSLSQQDDPLELVVVSWAPGLPAPVVQGANEAGENIISSVVDVTLFNSTGQSKNQIGMDYFLFGRVVRIQIPISYDADGCHCNFNTFLFVVTNAYVFRREIVYVLEHHIPLMVLGRL